MRFLVEYQREKGCTLADAEKIMNQVIHSRHHLNIIGRREFTLEDFFYYLFQADLNGPIKSQVCSVSFFSFFHTFLLVYGVGDI